MSDRQTKALDLGHDVYVRFTACEHGARTGALVAFGKFDRPGTCEGHVSWCAKCDHSPTWTIELIDPLTISPSVACGRHPEHHGFIRKGRWVPA